MHIDVVCAGPAFDKVLAKMPGLAERLGLLADPQSRISETWAQEKTAEMWLWLVENRREILDDFLVTSLEEFPIQGRRGNGFYLFLEDRAAAASWVTMSRYLFGVPDCAEKALCMDSLPHAMTTMWYLRDLPEKMLLSFPVEKELYGLSKFGKRAFSPRSGSPEQAYLTWRFGGAEKYALHARGLSDFAGRPAYSDDKKTEREYSVALAAAVLGIPITYAVPLATAGFRLSGIQAAWDDDMPVEYMLALGPDTVMP